MARMGNFKVDGLKELQKELNKLDKNVDEFAQACAKELAARLLRKVIKRTPVGDYSREVKVVAKRDSKKHKKGDVYTKKVSRKTGGTLRKGWTSEKGAGSDGLKTRSASDFVDTLKVNHFGDTYVIEITNPVEYASYVENGHRTANHKGYVPGVFMLRLSEKDLQDEAPAIIEKRIENFLKGVFK